MLIKKVLFIIIKNVSLVSTTTQFAITVRYAVALMKQIKMFLSAICDDVWMSEQFRLM